MAIRSCDPIMSKLTEEKVPATLFRMAFPMLMGTVAINTYTLVDTWYVSKLGTLQLAAMGFTFPVVMLFTFVARGLGTGITALSSHAMGRGDNRAASQIVSYGSILSVVVSMAISVLGIISIDPILRLLGARGQVLAQAGEYMIVWYAGALTMVFPMMGNGILISLGDSKSASRFMLLGAVLNCILDPIMIFGWLGFPAMGIWGAAWATVLSQAASSLWLVYLLGVKFPLLDFRRFRLAAFRKTSRDILSFAIPGCISLMLMPVSSALITSLISRHGVEAVAAVGAAGRLETFAFIIPMALGISLVPFVSQNHGAGQWERIRQAILVSNRFALLYGAFIALVFFALAPHLAAFFSQDTRVIRIFTQYMRIIAFGYGMMEAHRYCGFLFTGIHRPLAATVNNAIRVLALLVPLSYLGNHLMGILGVFWARLLTDLMSGAIGLCWVSMVLRRRRPASVSPSSQAAEALAVDIADAM